MCYTSAYPEDIDLELRVFVTSKKGVKRSSCRTGSNCIIYYRNCKQNLFHLPFFLFTFQTHLISYSSLLSPFSYFISFNIIGRTPTLYKIEPQAGSPLDIVRFGGYYRTTTSENLLQFRIGKFICDREDLEAFNMNNWDYVRAECRVAPETPGGSNTSIN